MSHRLQEFEDKFKKDGGEFMEYKIGELFEVKSNPQLDKENFVFSNVGKYPYFTRTIMNNGILGYVEYLDEEHKIKGNSLAVGMLGMQFFYMKSDFYAGQFTKTVYPKFDNFDEKKALYFIALFNKLQKLLQSVLVRDFEKTFYESKVVLPTKNNKPDFTFMEEYIHVLEMERVHVLENHLHVSGLDSYSLTSEESTVLNNLRSGNVVFKQYKIGNLFDIEGIRQAKSQSAIPNDDKGIPYVVQSQFNNMVSRFVNEKYLCNNNEPVCEGNAIVLGVTLAAVSYQDRKFGASQVITARAKFLNENIGNYFVALLRKLMVQFSYQNKPGIKIYKEMMVSLPTNENNQPDFAFMETYIQAIKKKVIKNVVDWKDKEIEKTKNVVSCVS